MLWVLIRSASNEYPQHMFSSRNKKEISSFRMKKVPYLLLCGSLQKDLSLLNPGQGIKGIIRTNTMFFFSFLCQMVAA